MLILPSFTLLKRQYSQEEEKGKKDKESKMRSQEVSEDLMGELERDKKQYTKKTMLSEQRRAIYHSAICLGIG